MAKNYQWRKEQYLYVGLENNKWIFPTVRSMKFQATAASMELSEAFEGCIALANELKRDTTDLNKRYETFAMLSMKAMSKLLKVPDD